MRGSASWGYAMTADLTFNQNSLLAAITGLFSLVVAAISGFFAYFRARSDFGRELEKINTQIDAQQKVEELNKIADNRQRYLTPLRYYAEMLSRRLGELETKLRSPEAPTVRLWFKIIKDHVARDQVRPDYGFWCCYEGTFSVTTLYYTCSYFQCARELRRDAPFRTARAQYSEDLEARLATITNIFGWDGNRGIWDALQEVIGERFTNPSGSKMTYGEMCAEHDRDELFRRAPFLRPLDFYWTHLDVEKAREIRTSMEQLIVFLDSHDPQLSRPFGDSSEGDRKHIGPIDLHSFN